MPPCSGDLLVSFRIHHNHYNIRLASTLPVTSASRALILPFNMSFGFSPGDIVLFTQFAAKVVSSLAEQGGSKTQFQLAERQCQAFLSVMTEVQSLDLSNVPVSFRNKIDEYSTSVQEFVKEFRDTIAHYEKSMGESSRRGLFRSAPRKVQWAFMAAEDLAMFRQSLAAQLDLVKIVIQSSIL